MSVHRFRTLREGRSRRRIRRSAVAAVLGLAVTMAAGASVASAVTLPSGPSGAASLAPTPPMGFNNWIFASCVQDEKTFTSAADEIVRLGLKNLGYQYVNTDDCWEAKSRDAAGNLVPDPAKFPHGMKWLGDYMHAHGLKFGIYSAASTITCRNLPGSDGHYQQDMKEFASWGVDYLKLDLCGSSTNSLIKKNCANTTASRTIKARYDQAARAIQAAGRPMILAVSAPASIAWWCGYTSVSYKDAMSWAPQDGQLWRTAKDSANSWSSILKTYTQNVQLGFAQSIGHWNDPDMLSVGSSTVSLTEQQTQFTLWAEMAAPLLMSVDLATIAPASLAILKNNDVIAVDQDQLGIQGRIVQTGSGYDVLSKPLADGSRAVVLFNKSNAAMTISTSAATAGLGASGHYELVDLVTKQTRSIGSSGVLAATVPAHGTVIYRVTPKQ